jgi:proteasome lid subunit RPN8/RPN11
MVEKPRSTTQGAPFQPRAVEDNPPSGLVLDQVIFDQIVAHLRTALPAEGCGLLATQVDHHQSERARRFYPGTNLEASATSYTMDPLEVVAALKDIDANGWRLGAIVHSHPLTPPTPSQTDLRLAFYPGALMVIVSFAASLPDICAWRVSSAEGAARLVGQAPIEFLDVPPR